MRYDGNYDLVYLHAPLVKEGGGVINTVSAYLASELGEMLPEIPHYRLRIEKTGSSWDIEYRASCYDAPMGELVFACLEPSEADARAKMLIYLIENHLISVMTFIK